jgi:hypothetical protein
MRYCLVTALLLLAVLSEAQTLPSAKQQQLQPADNPYLSTDGDDGGIPFTVPLAVQFLSDERFN